MNALMQNSVFEQNRVARTVRTGRVVVALLVLCLQLGPRAWGGEDRPLNRSSAAHKAIPLKILRYAERVIQRYDRDGDGVVKGEELKGLKIELSELDRDGDEAITPDEVAAYIAGYARRRPIESVLPRVGTHGFAIQSTESSSQQDLRQASSRTRRFYVPPSVLPKGLPSWFRSRDRDGDGQLSLAEFAPSLSEASVKAFSKYDRNGDGFLVPEELVSPARTGLEQRQRETEQNEASVERREFEGSTVAGNEEQTTESAGRSTPPAPAAVGGVPKRPLRAGSDRYANSGSEAKRGLSNAGHRSRSQPSSVPGPSWLPEDIRLRWKQLSPAERREALLKYRAERLEQMKQSTDLSRQAAVPRQKRESFRHSAKHSRNENQRVRPTGSGPEGLKTTGSKKYKSKSNERPSEKTRSKKTTKRAL